MASDTDDTKTDDTNTDTDDTGQQSGGESTLTVLLAGGINLAIAVLKAFAGVFTGSGAMLSEAGHSVADTFTEVLLLTALRKSEKPADRRHPFGYGKERYFWSLLAAVSIFVSGAVFAFIQGITTLTSGGQEQEDSLVAYIVLAVGFALESVSWVQAFRQVRGEAHGQGRSLRQFFRVTDDPTSQTVLFEDSAALAGLLLALAGIGLHQLTGSAVWDGVASLLIGLLLAAVAYMMGRTNRGLLIGRQADPRTVRRIRAKLQAATEVEALVDIQTMLLGTDSILVGARLDFDDTLGAADLERACKRLADELRAEVPDVTEVFLEPVPRTDRDLRQAVLERYGRAQDA